MIITDVLARNIRDVHGDAGSDWLARFPAIVEDCARQWSLTIGEPYGKLSYNYAARAVQPDGTPVVLKLGPPCRELSTEIEAVRLFAGEGSAQILDSDADVGAILLERLEPGASLSSLVESGRDSDATAAAITVMQKLWRTVPERHEFPLLANWGGLPRLRAKFNGGTGPLPESLIEQAERKLAHPTDSQTLIHGDLHHGNILSAQREPWLSIDPKGLIGHPIFDAATFLNCRLMDSADPQCTARLRIDQLSDGLGFEKSNLCEWAVAQSVLSAWWSVEDHGSGWESAIRCAQMLAALKRE